MEVKAQSNNLRMSPRKVRLVADLVRGQKIATALAQLNFANKAAALPIAKLIKSAVANAQHNFDLAEDNLFVKTISVDGGATLKRWMPRAQGRATPLRKRTSHINLILGELVDSGYKEAKKVELEKPTELKATEQPKQADGVKVEKKSLKVPKEVDVEKDLKEGKGEGRHGHAKLEGKVAKKAFAGKMFQRKSG